MGMILRKIGTLVLAAVAAVVLLAPAAYAQDSANATASTPAPAFHLDGSFTPDLPAPAAASFNFTDQGSPAQGGGSSAHHHEGFGFGILGGFLFASLGQSPLNGTDLSSKTGEDIGIFFGGNRPGRFGVEGQLYYNIRKAQDAAANDLSIYSIEIPVLLRANIGSQSLKGVLVYIVAGPAVDLQLKAKQANLDVKDNYKGLNVDIMFGGGVEITRFFIEVKEDVGLRGINNGNFATTSTIHDKTFSLDFGFRIN